MPEWVMWVLGPLKYLWPVLLALLLAKLEIHRRREQDALKAEMNGGTDPVATSDQDEPRGLEP